MVRNGARPTLHDGMWALYHNYPPVKGFGITRYRSDNYAGRSQHARIHTWAYWTPARVLTLLFVDTFLRWILDSGEHFSTMTAYAAGRECAMIDKFRQPVRWAHRPRKHRIRWYSRQRPVLLERPAHHSVRQDRSHVYADGRPGVRRLLDGGAPTSRPEGYECIPNILQLSVHLAHITKQIKFGCGIQHRADVAPSADGRGLRHRRYSHRRQGDLRRRTRIPHPRGRGVRRPHAQPRREPRSVRRAGGGYLQVLQQRVVLAPRQVLHDPSRGAVQGLHAQRDHPRTASRQPTG